MASICIFLLLTVTIISTGSAASGFASVQCKKETLGHQDKPSLLECVVKSPYDDTEIQWIKWEKDSKTLSFINRTSITEEPGYQLERPYSWSGKSIRVNLLITNTERKHRGSYQVKVGTDRGPGEDSTTLQVTAKYKKPTIHQISEPMNASERGTLICESDGGFPEGKLRWFDGNKELTSASETNVTQREDGLFRLSSTLPLGEGSSVFNYSCMVFNASGGREQESHFTAPDGVTPDTPDPDKRKELELPTKIGAPVVVIGSLIVGLLILILYRRRSQNCPAKVPTEDN